jgi:CheY-like chemotaxis protein
MQYRILVVDDQKIWRNIMLRVLGKKYDVELASSLSEALEKLEDSSPYQVVITDIGLSDDPLNIDGIYLLKEIHRRWPTISLIAISGRPASVDREQFKAEYHALDYIDRELFDDRESFMNLIEKGVYLSIEAQNSI